MAGAAIVMIIVGCMVASWMAAGTIPTLLYYGLKLISPTVYLLLCFLLTAFIAVCTGSSWGAISTIGVVMMGFQ